jgi:hypothetical protein
MRNWQKSIKSKKQDLNNIFTLHLSEKAILYNSLLELERSQFGIVLEYKGYWVGRVYYYKMIIKLISDHLIVGALSILLRLL